MTSQYKKFTKLIAKWPVDSSKGHRDLGKFLRDKIKDVFDSSDSQSKDLFNSQYNSINRIADNYYKKKYKRPINNTSTGFTTEECQTILSNEVLSYLKEENKNIFTKIFKKK